jgi:hypothetical protein
MFNREAKLIRFSIFFGGWLPQADNPVTLTITISEDQPVKLLVRFL